LNMTTNMTTAALRHSTSIVTRAGGSLHGLRLVSDEASPLCVRAFPFADIATAVAEGGLNTPGAYLLVGMDGSVARPGESQAR
jgi:hypothetical protein